MMMGKKLSAGVLQMKFMTKTRKKLEEQEDKKKNEELKKEFITDTKDHDESKTTFCKDLSLLEDLSFGRMSFKGCNPEKLMIYYQRKRRGEPSDDEESDDGETDVTDAQMAKSLSGAASSIANKFRGKGSNKRQEGNVETATHRLNFDASKLRKRKSGPEDFSHPPKFIKPSD